VSVPATALEEAVALLTIAMHAGGSELDGLIAELDEDGRSAEVLLAVVELCRSLCFTTARLVHTIDDQLTNEEALDLTDADVRAAALAVLRTYARNAVPFGDVSA
jgi:hypothetical protein